MKTRLGFVSNSSSASYYVTLVGSGNDIIEDLAEAVWTVTFDDKLTERVEEDIKRTEWSIQRIEQGKTSWLNGTQKDLEERLERSRGYLEFLRNRDNVHLDEYKEKMVALVMDTFGITKTVTDGTVKLEYFTSMHNSFTEGMPEVMQELVLMGAFNKTLSKILVRIDN